jgi:hypothetical protein
MDTSTITPELILGIVGTITGVLSLIISIHFNRKLTKKADIDQKRNKILVRGIKNPTAF